MRTLEHLNDLDNKSRKVREFVDKCICSSTPKSSNTHCYTKVRKHNFKSSDHETLRKSIIKLKSRTKRYCSLFSCNRVMCLHKSQTHVANYMYCKLKTLKLSTDIEKNPGRRPMSRLCSKRNYKEPKVSKL